MTTVKNKNKLVIAAMAAIAILCIIAVPLVGAQTVTNSAVGSVKTLNGKGYAYQEGQTTQYPATFTLTLQPASVSGIGRKFDVIGGTVVVNAVSYTITSGNGGVGTERHIVLLQAQGTSPDGQAVTLKLEGRYFWMGGNLYVLRVAAKLQTDNGNYVLLMRASVHV